MKIRELLKVVNLSEITKGIEFFEGDYIEGHIDSRSLEFHTDFIHAPNSYEETYSEDDIKLDKKLLEREVEAYQVMSPQEYNHSVLANGCIDVSEFGWNDNDRVLCILLKKEDDYEIA